MSLHCIKNPWLPKILLQFRLYKTAPCPQLSASLLHDLKQNRLEQVHVKICKQPTPLPTHFYNYLLKGYAKNFESPRYLEKSLDVLKEMRTRGVEPNSQSYMQLIMGLGLKVKRLNNLEKYWLQKWFDEFVRIESGNLFPKKFFAKYKKLLRCVHYKGDMNPKKNLYLVLKTFENKKLRDSETWNLVIASCVQGKNIKDAEEVLERARLEQVANSTSYHIVIKGYLKSKDQQSAHRVFKRMLEDKMVADKSTYETFIQYYLTQEEKNTVETLKRLWQGILLTTKKREVVSSVTSIALSKYYRSHGALEEAEQLYLDLKLKRKALDKDYLEELNQVIMQFVDKRQYISAVSLYFDLVGQGYSPNSKTLEHITRSFESNSQFEAIEQLMKAIPQDLKNK
ncbi:hypothetical protein G6F56_009471 [Rhizopus delemar]|nr:hypothetical protein G6F56_009471 [Rhizopus delemar]